MFHWKICLSTLSSSSFFAQTKYQLSVFQISPKSPSITSSCHAGPSARKKNRRRPASTIFSPDCSGLQDEAFHGHHHIVLHVCIMEYLYIYICMYMYILYLHIFKFIYVYIIVFIIVYIYAIYVCSVYIYIAHIYIYSKYVKNQHPLTTSVVPVYIFATSWINKALSLCVPTVQKARTATAATECQHQLP